MGTQEDVKAGVIAAFQSEEVRSILGSIGSSGNNKSSSGPALGNYTNSSQQRSYTQAQSTTISSRLGITEENFNTITGLTESIVDSIEQGTLLSVEFLTQQQSMLRRQYEYAFSMRDSIKGFTLEALAEKDAIQGLAGTAITTAEEIFQLSSGQVPEEVKAEYGEVADVLFKSFEHPEQAAKSFRQVFSSIASETPKLLETLNKQQLAEITSYKQNLELSDREIKDLLERQYAYTGEASSNILGEIGEVAMRMSKATGLGADQIKQDIVAITTDVDRFGNIGVDAAGRISAALTQVGLDVGVLGKMIDNFSSFEGAAGKMSDLASMFDIQLDAMEMTYLANEDQEEFFFRMREEILNSGVDIDNMSHARARALSDTLGMSMTQMKTFLKEEEMELGQEELTQAGQMELEFKGVENAMENFGDKATRSLQPVEVQLDAIRKGQLIPLREEALAAGNALGTAYGNIFENLNLYSEDSLKMLGKSYTALEGFAGLADDVGKQFSDAVKKGYEIAIDTADKKVEEYIGEMPEVKIRTVVQAEIAPIDEDFKRTLEAERVKTERAIADTEVAKQEIIESNKEVVESNNRVSKSLSEKESQIVFVLDTDIMAERTFKWIEDTKGTVVFANGE